jgi:uncharacterized membrane protein YbaN (DUF454 family)
MDITLEYRQNELEEKQAKQAAQLLKMSARNSFNPRVDIDWDAPLEPGKWFVPESRCTLYGTDLWDSLSVEQRINVSREELASNLALGVWTEWMLLEAVSRYSYDLDITSPAAQFAMTESADEVRHMIMFADVIQKIGCKSYRVPPRTRIAGIFLKSLAPVPWLWAQLMMTEQLFDRFQREMAEDETLQPLIREMSRIHVVEEARHISFAQTEIEKFVAKASRAQRFMVQMLLAMTLETLAKEVFNPEMYKRAGLDPKAARKAALANPNNRASFKWAAEEIAEYYKSIGLIGGMAEKKWKKAGFL